MTANDVGCCSSRPESSDSPYPREGGSQSTRAINPSQAGADGAQSASENPGTARRRRRRDQGPLDQHINKPLRRHEWSSKDRLWTRRQLDAEREAFFDTRVTGRAEIWQTIHAALRVLWEPASEDSQADDGLNGLATAQTILDAAEISMPTGNLVHGAYDSLGNLYQVPKHIVSDPTNIADEDEAAAAGAGTDARSGMTTDGVADDYDDDEDDEDASATGDGASDVTADDAEARSGGGGGAGEKGKGVVGVSERISVRARLSENGRDYRVAVAKTDSARIVAKRIAEESGLASTKKIRLAYMGRILKDKSSLESQGWETGKIVNAFVFDR